MTNGKIAILALIIIVGASLVALISYGIGSGNIGLSFSSQDSNKVSQLENQISQLQSSQESLNQQLILLQLENDRLKNQQAQVSTVKSSSLTCDRIYREIKDVEDEIDELEEDEEDLKDEIKDEKNEESPDQEKIDDLEEELEDIEDDIDEEKDNLRDLRNDLIRNGC